MLGDRYGWIPLPNIIEKMVWTNYSKLRYWRQRLFNIMVIMKMPIKYQSLISLSKRIDEYEDMINGWIESKLRDIFQTAVSDLDKHQEQIFCQLLKLKL